MQNATTKQFSEVYWELCNFIEDTDRFPRKSDGPSELYDTLNEYRELYATGKLPAQDAAQLTHIKGWEWDKRRAAFSERIEEFVEFFEANGEAPSQIHPTESKLGRWVGAMICRYNDGTLKDWQQAALERTHGWAWDLRAARFERRLNQLRNHAELFGSLRNKDLAPELQGWVANRRSEYRAGKLTAAQIQWIESIPGWSWGRLAAESNA
jgi:hypothetical protein